MTTEKLLLTILEKLTQFEQKVDERLAHIEHRLDTLEQRVTRIETVLETTNRVMLDLYHHDYSNLENFKILKENLSRTSRAIALPAL